MRPTIQLLAVLSLAAAYGCAAPHTRQCNINSDCQRGSYCNIGGECHIDCRLDLDCASHRCDNLIGKCVVMPDGGPPPDGPPAPPPDFSGVDTPPDLAMGEPPPDLTMPPLPDLAPPPTMRPYADVCTLDTQCKSGLCSKNPFAVNDKKCTGGCGGGCALGDFCYLLPDPYGQQCAASDIGAPCQKAIDCRAGACLGTYCTRLCQTATECPAGWSCSLIPSQGVHVCVNVDITPSCNNDSQCIEGTWCDVANHRCLGECVSNMGRCPLFHNCKFVNNHYMCAPSDPNAVGRGGIGATCVPQKGGTDCRSGTCLTDTMNKSFCVTACGITKNVGQWCPGNWGCNPINDGMGGYILGCLQAGQASPGAKCNTNTDCASGLCAGYCTRFCDPSSPCPSSAPKCTDQKIVADSYEVYLCEQ